MAQRRMFSLKIIETDYFLDMPATTQLLYFHLAMRGDDDGFVSSPKRIMRDIGCQQNDYDVLIAKKFIIPFESGICVIKHWRVHNYIQNDRHDKTQYQQEFAQLNCNENKVYELTMDTKCIQDVSKMETQVRLGEVRLGKDNNIMSGSNPTAPESNFKKPEKKKSFEERMRALARDFTSREGFFDEPIDQSDKQAMDFGAFTILTNLNQTTRQAYRFVDTNLDRIKARLKSGATISQCYGVIEIKSDQWLKDEKMQIYLRPATLFAKEKFEMYLGEFLTKQKMEERKNGR